MKKIQYILLAALVLGTAACSDSWMTTQPEGGTKTADQKAKAELQNADAAAANVNAMYAQFIALYVGVGDGYGRHNDFGYSSICHYTDVQGMDFVGRNIGYNWYRYSQYSANRDYATNSTMGIFNLIIWNTYYKIIYAANNVIGSADESDPGALEEALCQAFTVRAFCYFQLAQLYQFPYDDAHKTSPCVPIVVPNMPSDKQLNNPRATVQEVYDLINHDLNYACNSAAFKAFKPADNGYCTAAVAYGVRARVNLVLGNKSAAAADAQKALDLSGATPLSIEECGKPGFADANAHNVIWGNIVVETNEVVETGIINWPSHLSSFYGDGYVGVGGYSAISTDLYSKISDTDVRKGWWLNSKNESPLLDVPGYDVVKENIVTTAAQFPHINVKFGTGDGTTTGSGAAAGDWIVMRAEEMKLIIAEGNDDKNALEEFVQTYRDPNYKKPADLSVTDAVWIQRRIELWGEGFAFQDILRLHKPIIRKTTGTNWPTAWQQDIPADHGCLILRIPQAEEEANKGIGVAGNNPIVEFK